MRESYKGRKLVVRLGKGRTQDRIESYVNGQIIGFAYGKDAEREMDQLRRLVDEADKRPEAYGDYLRQSAA